MGCVAGESSFAEGAEPSIDEPLSSKTSFDLQLQDDQVVQEGPLPASDIDAEQSVAEMLSGSTLSPFH